MATATLDRNPPSSRDRPSFPPAPAGEQRLESSLHSTNTPTLYLSPAPASTDGGRVRGNTINGGLHGYPARSTSLTSLQRTLPSLETDLATPSHLSAYPNGNSNESVQLEPPAAGLSKSPFRNSTRDLRTSQLETAPPSNHTHDGQDGTQNAGANADALHIQRTYQRISRIGGIPRDGFVEGMELTRERRTEETITGYLSAPTSPVVSPENGRSFGNIVDELVNGNTTTSSMHGSGRGQNGTLTDASREEQQELKFLQRVDRYGFFEPTYGKFSRLALLPRKECLDIPSKKVSRSAASASSKASTSNAGAGTSAGAGADASAKRALSQSTRGKRRSLIGSSASSTGVTGSPYLSVPTPAGSGASSLANSTASRHPAHTSQQHQQHADGTSRSSSATSLASSALSGNSSAPGNSTTPRQTLEKESLRTSKWQNEMLTPALRDSGGNIVAWKLQDSVAVQSGDGAPGNRLRRRVVKGIPDIWRAAAWEALLRRRSQTDPNGRRQGRGIADPKCSKRYYDLILQPCAQDVQIDLDVPRTISGHLYFHTRYGLGQRSLFNVSHAFALLCPECGYCQGMGSLAATFLCYMPPEKAYAAMVTLHDEYDLHSIYQPGFPGMLECFAVQEKLVQLLMPDVHDIFERNYIGPSSFATKWYITLFSNCISFSAQLRIFDLFLLFGLDALVLVSVALIWCLRRHLASPSADFESILSLLSSFFVPEDEDALLRWVGKLLKRKEVREIMRDTRLEWKKKVEQDTR